MAGDAGWSAADNTHRTQQPPKPLRRRAQHSWPQLLDGSASRLTAELSGGTPAFQHAGAPALVCALARPPAGRALYVSHDRCSDLLGDSPKAGWTFSARVHYAWSLLPPSYFCSALNEGLMPNNGRSMMPAQLQRRNARGTFGRQAVAKNDIDAQPAQLTLADRT